MKESETKNPASYNLKNDIQSAIDYVNKKKMDKDLAILIQYKKHSGLKRGYIIDLKKKIAFDSFMVSHGCGDQAWGRDFTKDNPRFSNKEGSHLSSLGKYKIGTRGSSNWGIGVKYYLHGLESSNSNALKRTIVLHGWNLVSDKSTHPNGTPEGWGCPAVSNKMMQKLDSCLKTKKNILLWAH